MKGAHRINPGGGRSTARVTATAAPSDAPKYTNAIRVHVWSQVHMRASGAGVTRQAVFGRLTRITAIPAIVEEQDACALLDPEASHEHSSSVAEFAGHLGCTSRRKRPSVRGAQRQWHIHASDR